MFQHLKQHVRIALRVVRISEISQNSLTAELEKTVTGEEVVVVYCDRLVSCIPAGMGWPSIRTVATTHPTFSGELWTSVEHSPVVKDFGPVSHVQEEWKIIGTYWALFRVEVVSRFPSPSGVWSRWNAVLQCTILPAPSSSSLLWLLYRSYSIESDTAVAWTWDEWRILDVEWQVECTYLRFHWSGTAADTCVMP